MAELFRSYSGAVTTVARSMLWSDDLVADAVQSTFVKAWNSRAEYDPQLPFAPWLYSIARRTTIDLVRFEKRRLGASLELNEPSMSEPGLEEAWERFEIRVALDNLPDEEREVVRLQHLEGHTHRAISELLGIPLGTVKSRSHRAHRRLSELLGHLVGEPEATGERMERGR